MLTIKNISKTFLNGTINEKTVIRNLSLDIDEGDFITVLRFYSAVCSYN